MKWNDKIRAKKTIRATSRHFGVSPAQSRAEMQQAIDIGWERSQNDPAAKAYWQQLFPAGKPTVEEFIAVLGNRVRNGNQSDFK